MNLMFLNISSFIENWMKHKLESRFLGDISVTSASQMTPHHFAESEEMLNSLLMKVKEES